MADIVLMPKMNLEMIEGVIGSWTIEEGSEVHVDDVLCEVENEKEVAPVYSSYDGIVVKHVYDAGESCPVGKPLCIVAAPGEDWKEEYDKALALKNEKKKEFTIDRKIVKGSGSGTKMSPKIKKLLRDNGIEAEAIQAAFPGVKITEDIIRQYLAGGGTDAKAEGSAAAPEGEPAARDMFSGGGKSPASVLPPDEEGDVRERATTIRKTIAGAMLESCHRTARLTNFLEVDMTRVVRRVKELRAEGKELSYTAVLIKACAMAMKDNRIINAMLDEASGEIVYKKRVNIGCATDSETGLVVPVIKDADRKDCLEITSELRALSGKVRSRTLTADERSGGTFTVSSIGMYDADFFTPIINYPQAAIMGVGRIKTVPRYTDDTFTTIAPRSIMEIGLTYDHRLIDGGPAMRYMLAVRDILESDESLLA